MKKLQHSFSLFSSEVLHIDYAKRHLQLCIIKCFYEKPLIQVSEALGVSYSTWATFLIYIFIYLFFVIFHNRIASFKLKLCSYGPDEVHRKIQIFKNISVSSVSVCMSHINSIFITCS